MKMFENFDFSQEKLAQAEKLFTENEHLVYHSIKKFICADKMFDEDLVQDCKLALWKACLTFDEEKTKFSTYAVNCIHNSIMQQRKHDNRVKRRDEGTTVSIENTTLIGGEGLADADIMLSEALADRSHETINLFNKYEDIFTSRQMKIFNYRLDGLSFTQIGKKLGISNTMVGYELKRMKKKWEDNHINFGGYEY